MVMDNVIAQNAVMILLQSNLYLQPPLHNRYFFCPGGQKKLIHTLTLYWIDHHGDLTRWWGMKQLGLMFQLISTPSLPTQPMKGCTTPLGSMPPTLYEQQCGFFYVPQESKQRKSCDTGPIVCPYPRRLENLTVCRCHNKGSTFSSVVLRPAVVDLLTMATFFCPQWWLLWRGSIKF